MHYAVLFPSEPIEPEKRDNIVDTLVFNGVKVNARRGDGKTALSLTKEKTVKRLLKSHGERE